jgi:hypothetical protein
MFALADHDLNNDFRSKADGLFALLESKSSESIGLTLNETLLS